MSAHRDARRSALQSLFQFDTGSADAPEVVRGSLEHAPGDDAAHRRGFELATLAWEFRDEADAAVAALTSEWPTHRQPIVDRAILRLAFYELTQTQTPPKVVINEAVELAKEYSTEKSPLFINGILDKLYRDRQSLPSGSEEITEATDGADAPPRSPVVNGEGSR